MAPDLADQGDRHQAELQENRRDAEDRETAGGQAVSARTHRVRRTAAVIENPPGGPPHAREARRCRSCRRRERRGVHRLSAGELGLRTVPEFDLLLVSALIHLRGRRGRRMLYHAAQIALVPSPFVVLVRRRSVANTFP